MYKFLVNYFTKRYLPRWIVLLFDILTVVVILQVSFFIRFGFNFEEVQKNTSLNHFIATTFLYTVLFFYFKSYSGIIRYSGLEDTVKIFKVVVAGGIIGFIISFLSEYFNFAHLKIALPKGVIVINSLLLMFELIATRLVVRSIYTIVTNQKEMTVKSVAIYGAGGAGLITKNTLLRDKKNKYSVCYFIDDNKYLSKKVLDGVTVIRPNNFFTPKFINKCHVEEVIIAIEDLNAKKKNEIVEKCLNYNIKVRIIPSVERWVNGELKSDQIKEVIIEDLLEREPIIINNNYTKEELTNKVILVTGAAGSIGSEIVRQLVSKEPTKIILFEQSESPLHELRMEINSLLSKNYPKVELKYVVGDIRNVTFVEKVFDKYKPNIVFHAAAYKHVPLMEEYPSQAVATNVKGTKNIADASVKFGSEKFVMVSTDKAVNPTNVMGATKRIAEIYIQSLSETQKTTKFITTRFGNVLGSNGSVIPMFKKQIASGGPITVTHKDITRYFMTIPEACQLVLEAGVMGKGGEIFIFDMGESVKIIDVAKKMIKLSGYNYPEDIDIVFSGLRPGEKLYEELLATKENTINTYHPKIMLAKIRLEDHVLVSTEISDLLFKIDSDKFDVVKQMKVIVPEFISNNSEFCVLDSVDNVKKTV